MKIVMVTPVVLVVAEQCLHRAKDLFCFCPASEELGAHKELGEDTARTLTQAGHKDIPCYMASCSASKAGIMKKEREDVQSNSVGLPNKVLHVMGTLLS